jgi:hypothetical protein
VTETEQVISDAEKGALYLRTLVNEGVPMHAAVSMTQAYTSSLVMIRRDLEGPKLPWSPDRG